MNETILEQIRQIIRGRQTKNIFN